MFQYTEKLKDLFFFDLKAEALNEMFSVDLKEKLVFQYELKD